jgi:hypothetical protein
MVDLGITKSDTLESAIAKAGAHTMGGTDCSLPVRDAGTRGLEVDAFLTINNEYPFVILGSFTLTLRATVVTLKV